MKLTCLIIDDEELARNILEAYAAKIDNLEVVRKCKNAKEAAAILEKEKVDIMFLDIQMPQMTGLEFLRQLSNPPKVIFTTAFSHYALEGYELEVVDYLLKPIGFERFQKAVEKTQILLNNSRKARAYETSQEFAEQFIMVKEGYNHHKIYLKDIYYIQAMQEYSAYHTVQGRVLELKTLSKVIHALPDAHFVRIHRSYVVARAAVKKQAGNEVILENGSSIPIGKTYRGRIRPGRF